MSVSYRAVGWNPTKRTYDGVLAAILGTYVATFVAVTLWVLPTATIETLLIRAWGTAAFLMLHVVLSIGPLCRIDSRFLPLLYNRRHLGVTMSLVGLSHAAFSIVQFHASGDETPIVSLLTTSAGISRPESFPFQILGLFALGILGLMAATSHDYWLRTLTPPVWKLLHMGVYVAYAALVMHVALGLLQSDRDARLVVVLLAGVAWVLGLHLVAARRERATDRRDLGRQPEQAVQDPGDQFVDVGPVGDIPEGRATIALVSGERIAIFRYGGLVSAVSNVCQHQNGPLGEGRIRDGCIVCPWHGYEYLPHSGASPAPFTEKVPTFRVRVSGGRVLVDPRPFPPGTPQEPAFAGESHAPAG